MLISRQGDQLSPLCLQAETWEHNHSLDPISLLGKQKHGPSDTTSVLTAVPSPCQSRSPYWNYLILTAGDFFLACGDQIRLEAFLGLGL